MLTVTEGSLDKINPDFIYNRMDLYDPDVMVLSCGDYTVEVSVRGRTAVLGGWLLDLPSDVAFAISSYIFSRYKKVLKVRIDNTCRSFGISVTKNHFRIELPVSETELEGRLSSKGRYNIKRERRLLEEKCGSVSVKEYDSENVPDEVFDEYFKCKEATHGTDYKLDKNEYINKYHVSNIYILRSELGIMAIILSCEQCPVVYIENLTYNTEYSKFSPGQVLYHEYLLSLVRKGFSSVFLEGGDLDYKRRYGSIEETVYDNVIMRNSLLLQMEKILRFVKKNIKRMLGR